MDYRREYIKVLILVESDGKMQPRIIIWKDGTRYKIDRVVDVRPAHADKAGGQGDRYKVIINGKERYIFFEHPSDPDETGRWFVESAVGA